MAPTATTRSRNGGGFRSHSRRTPLRAMAAVTAIQAEAPATAIVTARVAADRDAPERCHACATPNAKMAESSTGMITNAATAGSDNAYEGMFRALRPG